MEQDFSNNEFKKNDFKIPENYFDNLNSSIMHKVYPTKSKWVVWKKVAYISAAACIVVMLTIGIWKQNKPTFAKELANTQIESSDVDIIMDINELSDTDLAEITNTKQIDSLYTSEVIESTLPNTPPQEENIDLENENYYLFEEEIEI